MPWRTKALARADHLLSGAAVAQFLRLDDVGFAGALRWAFPGHGITSFVEREGSDAERSSRLVYLTIP